MEIRAAPKIPQGFFVKPRSNYNYRKPFHSTSDKIPAQRGHGEFTAGKIYETFDAMKAYAEGREKKPGEFKKERTTIDNTEKNMARPTDMKKEQANLLSSVDISAEDFANWFLSGSSPKKQMEKLANVPSSVYTEKTINQLGGGLGEGLLVYSFPEFIETMHKKFGIEGFESQVEGLRTELKNLLSESEVLRPEDMQKISAKMEEVSCPIVQAVLDAEGVDVYGQFDPSSENILQRDTQMGQAADADERSAEMRDDSGETTESAETDLEAVEKAQRQKDLEDALNAKPKALRNREKVTDSMLEELYFSETTPTLRDLAKVELLRRGVNIPYVIDENTKELFDDAFTNNPKSLNSDAGKVLTSDVNPNLKKATLLSRIAGDRDLKKEFEAWKKEKGDSLKRGSFKMNFVDRADPLKQFHRGIINILKKVGIDENHPLYDQLNVHGRLHQYFGKGYETVEQAQLRFIEPIKDLMREHGVDLKTFGEYLLARAAPSRNRQLKARADEYLADIAKEEKEGEGSDKYKKERAKYYKGDKFIVTSGIETDAAVKVVESMEQDKNFKAFAQKALPLYYKMNLEALDQLTDSGMIQEILDKEKQGLQDSMRELR